MKSFIETVRRSVSALGRGVLGALRGASAWFSVAGNLCLAVIGLCLAFSVVAWAVAERSSEAVVFFPDGHGSIRGEKREVPRTLGAEERAELFVSELLLGPESLRLSPAFAPGTRAESVLYRKGNLYVDLSPDAALTGSGDPAAVKAGLAALERTLRAALPGIKRITLAIGGFEPYADGLPDKEG